MADMTQTPANVSKQSGAIVRTDKVAGEALDAGDMVYLKGGDDKWWKADADAIAQAAVGSGSGGMCLNTAEAADAPVEVQTSGNMDPGGTVVVGTTYYISVTAGGVGILGDLGTGDFISIIGVGISSTVIKMAMFVSGVAIP